MRFLLAIVILAGLGWSGWWVWNASLRERAITDWLAERRAEGWLAEAADVRVTGFPNRLDTFVTDLALADPEQGWRWSADEFQILSLSWRPHHVIAVWPGEQVIGTPYETITVTSGLMRGSVVFEPNARLVLDRSTIEIEDMVLHGDGGWQAGVARAVVATRRPEAGGANFAHDLGMEASGLMLPAGWTGRLDRAEAVLPEAIDAVGLDATLAFDRAWDRASVEGENPALEAIRIRDLSAVWGELDLRGQGRLAADDNGLAEGAVDLRARNWRAMLEIAEASGALPGGIAGALRGGLDLIATLAGDRNSLTVPLSFQDGRTRLGPVVIGDAPRLSRER